MREHQLEDALKEVIDLKAALQKHVFIALIWWQKKNARIRHEFCVPTKNSRELPD